VPTETFERAVAAVAAETTIRGLLGRACRELVDLLDANACAISRVIGDLLVGLDEHTRSARPLAHGHEYLISDFPLTREVVESGDARWVSRLDESPEPHEAALLEELGFQSLLMVCLPAHGGCWGLIEVYENDETFDAPRAEIATRFAAHLGALLEQLEPPAGR
jgi:hypothetical protein